MSRPLPRVAGTELLRALAFERAVLLAAATRSWPVTGGVAHRHDALPDKWALNGVVLDAPLHPALRDAPEAVVALADDVLADLPHRWVVVHDGTAGEALGRRLPPGWQIQRVLYMALRHPPDRDPGADRARRLTEPELAALQLATALEDRGAEPGDDGAAQIVAGEAAIRGAADWLAFGAGRTAERLESSATVLLDRPSGIAIIDEVGTLAAARGHGLARAAIGAAIAAAQAAGCDVVIPADADDWPHRLYGRMGFEQIGLTVTLLRTG